jgi:capsular polysaccharide biosynthesis protein
VALPDYIRILKRRWWIPVLLMFVTVLTTGVLVFGASPTYSATAAVFAAGPTTGAARSVTFAQAASSNTLALAVIAKLKLDMSVERLSREITVGIVGPNLYSIKVTDPNPKAAAQLASQVAEQSVVLYRQLAAQAGISSADQALLKARDQLARAYGAAVTARLLYQSQHPSAFDPKAPIRDVSISAQAIQLQLQEQAASLAYSQALAAVNRQGLDQVTKAQDYSAFVLDQPIATPNTQVRVPEVAFAGAAALLVGIGLAFVLEHLRRKSLLEAESVEEMVGAPVIGIIPRANPQTFRRNTRGSG